MDDSEMNIFLDKLRLSFVVLNKESDLIEVYSELIKKIRSGAIPIENVVEWTLYQGCWSIADELYNFLRFNKIKEIRNKKEQSQYIKDKIDSLHKIMYNYVSLSKKVDINDLQKVVPILYELVSLSGYHDDKSYQKEIDESPQFL